MAKNSECVSVAREPGYLPNLPYPKIRPVTSAAYYVAKASDAAATPWVEGFAAGTLMLLALLMLIRSVRTGARRAALVAASAAGLMVILIAVGSVLLHVTSQKVKDGQYRAGLQFARNLAIPFSYVSWVPAWRTNPGLDIGEAAASAGIVKAIGQGRLEEALWFADWPSRSPEGQRVRAAAFLANGEQQLRQGALEVALKLAQKAADIDRSSMEAADAIATVRVYLASHLARQGEFEKAGRHYDAIAKEWRPEVRVELAALLARQKLLDLMEADPPDLEGALSAVEREDAAAPKHWGRCPFRSTAT